MGGPESGEGGEVVVLLAVLGAAVLHAAWNAMAHGVPDRLGGFALLVLFVLWRRGLGFLRVERRYLYAGLGGGLVSLVAYGLVLWAQTRGALAAVAALRETSIIFGAIIGALFFGERFGPKRALAAAVVVTGILLISLG